MISSNLKKSGIAIPSDRLAPFMAARSMKIFAAGLNELFPAGEKPEGGSFITNGIRLLADLDSSDAETGTKKIRSSGYLRSWFATLLCIVLYGSRETGSLVTETVDTADDSALRVIAEKVTADDALPELKVYRIKDDTSSTLIGCVSPEYLVLPLCSRIRDEAEWVKLHDSLVKRLADTTCPPEEMLPEIKETIQRIQLWLTAQSLPDTGAAGAAKKLMTEISGISREQFKGDTGRLPYTEAAGMRLYHTDSRFTLSLPEKVFAGRIFISEKNGEAKALYPFTSGFAGYLSAGNGSVESMKLSAVRSADQSLFCVSVDAMLSSRIRFIGSGSTCGDISFLQHRVHSYDRHHISTEGKGGMPSIPSFCVFPDIPAEYGYRCSRYVYIHRCGSTAADKYIEKRADAVTETADGSRYAVRAAESPEHLIFIQMNEEGEGGYLLDLRTKLKRHSALLTEGGSSFTLAVTHGLISDSPMRMYLDLGSSSSAAGYKFGSGDLTEHSYTGGSSIVRIIPEDSSTGGYEEFLPLNTEAGIIPSVIAYAAEENKELPEELKPYNKGTLPAGLSLTRLERAGVRIVSVGKSQLPRQITPEMTAAVAQLGFAGACHTVNSGASALTIIPSYPDIRYAQNYMILWQYAADIIRCFFPQLKVISAAKPDNSAFLSESIAAVSGIKTTNDVLCISIDIGDSTTDISGIYRNSSGELEICGYSSVEYAGRDLAAASFRSVMERIRSSSGSYDREFRDTVFGSGDRPGLFVNIGTEAESILSTLKAAFTPGRETPGNWHDHFNELLTMAELSDSPEAGGGYFSREYTSRTALLMPLLAELTAHMLHTLDRPDTPVNITFCGGASGSIGKYTGTKEFEDSFSRLIRERAGERNICITKAVQSSKSLVIRGLAELEVRVESSGEVKLSHNGSLRHADWEKADPSAPYPGSEKWKQRLSEAESAVTPEGFRKYTSEALRRFGCPDTAGLSRRTDEELDLALDSSVLEKAAAMSVYPEVIPGIAYLIAASEMLSGHTRNPACSGGRIQ